MTHFINHNPVRIFSIVPVKNFSAEIYTSGIYIITAHLKSCVVDQIEQGKGEVVDELLVTLRKMMK